MTSASHTLMAKNCFSQILISSLEHLSCTEPTAIFLGLYVGASHEHLKLKIVSFPLKFPVLCMSCW